MNHSVSQAMKVYHTIFPAIIISLALYLTITTHGQINSTSQTNIHENTSEGNSSFTFNIAGNFRDTPATGYNLVSPTRFK